MSDGIVDTGKNAINVKGATTATVLMAIDTNYRLSSEVFCEEDWSKKLKPIKVQLRSKNGVKIKNVDVRFNGKPVSDCDIEVVLPWDHFE